MVERGKVGTRPSKISHSSSVLCICEERRHVADYNKGRRIRGNAKVVGRARLIIEPMQAHSTLIVGM
jgi:hypothetical protein